MTHVIQAEWTIQQMSQPNPLFFLSVVSNSDWRIWVRPVQTSMFPAFHTLTICFGPFLKVSISYSFSHFCRTPSLLRKMWTKNEWKGRADWQRKFPPLAVDSSVKGAEDLECPGALVPHLAACLWREGSNDGWEEKETENCLFGSSTGLRVPRSVRSPLGL